MNLSRTKWLAISGVVVFLVASGLLFFGDKTSRIEKYKQELRAKGEKQRS